MIERVRVDVIDDNKVIANIDAELDTRDWRITERICNIEVKK